MARQNPVYQLAQIALSAALLSGCILESAPEDGVSWGRDEVEAADTSAASKSALRFDLSPVDVISDPTRPTEEPPKQAPPPPEEDIDEEGAEHTVPVTIDRSPVPKLDPQPEPQIGIHKAVQGGDYQDPQPEPRVPDTGRTPDED